MAHVRLDNISKKFGSHTALSGLDLDLDEGERLVGIERVESLEACEEDAAAGEAPAAGADEPAAGP